MNIPSQSFDQYYDVKIDELEADENTEKNEQVDKGDYLLEDVIYSGTWYSWFIFAISLADYILYICFQNQTLDINVGFIIVWIVITSIQVLDYILLCIFASKQNISIMGLSFLIYTIVFLFLIATIIIDIYYGAKHQFDYTQMFRWKFCAPIFLRGYLPSINITRKARPTAACPKSNISDLMEILVQTKDFAVCLLHAIYHLICFILFFLGFFSFTSTMQEITTFDIFYFEVVTLSTVGYGDITFPDMLNRGITIIFIVSSLIYVPQAINLILNEFQESLPKAAMKAHCSNGVVVIGKFDRSFALLSRQIVPSDHDIAYLVTEFELSSIAGSILSGQSSFKIAPISQFSRQVCETYVLQRSSKVLCLSTKADDDRETILNAAILASYTDYTMPMLVVLYNDQFENLAKIMLEERNSKNIIILNMSTMISEMIVASSIFDGFCTFICNSMTSKFIQVNEWSDSDTSLTKILNDNDNEEQRKKTVAWLKKQYNRSVKFMLYPKKEIPLDNQRLIGSEDFCLTNKELIQTASSSKKFVQSTKEFSKLVMTEAVNTQKIGIIAYEKTDQTLLLHTLLNLKNWKKKVVLATDIELVGVPEDWEDLQRFGMNMTIDEEDQMRQVDSLIVLLFPDEDREHDNIHSIVEKEAKLLGIKRVLIVTDIIPEQEDYKQSFAQLFRSGEVLPSLKAYIIAHLICKHQQTLTAMAYLEEVVQKQVEVEMLKVTINDEEIDEAGVKKGSVSVGSVKEYNQANKRDTLYFINSHTVLTYPDDDFGLEKGDVVVVAKAK